MRKLSLCSRRRPVSRVVLTMHRLFSRTWFRGNRLLHRFFSSESPIRFGFDGEKGKHVKTSIEGQVASDPNPFDWQVELKEVQMEIKQPNISDELRSTLYKKEMMIMERILKEQDLKADQLRKQEELKAEQLRKQEKLKAKRLREERKLWLLSPESMFGDIGAKVPIPRSYELDDEITFIDRSRELKNFFTSSTFSILPFVNKNSI